MKHEGEEKKAMNHEIHGKHEREERFGETIRPTGCREKSGGCG